jgi:hypothetical protein
MNSREQNVTVNKTSVTQWWKFYTLPTTQNHWERDLSNNKLILSSITCHTASQFWWGDGIYSSYMYITGTTCKWFWPGYLVWQLFQPAFIVTYMYFHDQYYRFIKLCDDFLCSCDWGPSLDLRRQKQMYTFTQKLYNSIQFNSTLLLK